MRPRLSQFFLIIALGVCFTACKSLFHDGGSGANLPPVTGDPALAAGFSIDEIIGARKLYQAKCVRCHKFYDPTEYDAAEWHSWMTKMSKKARLNSDQERLLSRYLIAFRAVGKTGAETVSPKH